MNPNATSNAIRNERVFRTVSYVLVFLMLMCVIMAASALIHNAIPAWHSDVMAGVMVLVVIDRFYTYPRFKTLDLFSQEWAVTFGVQWIVLVIFIRLLLSYANGLNAFVTDMRLFAHGYLENFFNPEFVVTLFLSMLAWYIPRQFLALLDEIGLDQAIALREASVPIRREEEMPQRRLVELVFNLGIILVLVTVLASLNFQSFLSGTSGAYHLDPRRFSGGEAAVLLYFLFGLALLTQGRLMSLQTRWNIQRIPVSSDNLAKRWGLYSALFLCLLVLAVGLLPTGDSLGIFSLLASLLSVLLMIVVFIGRLILSVAFMFVSLFFILFGKELPANAPPPTLLPFEPEPHALNTGNAIFILIRSILLWGSLILIVVFSLTRFLRQHDEFMLTLRKAPILQWLRLAWEWLRRNASRTREGLARVLTEGWQSISARLERRRLLTPSGWIRLRALDPRRRVYFFYLAMIRRGGERGLTRQPSQTPSEYARSLEKDLPSASEDIDSITQAFVEARYSRHEVDARQADFVKAIWERIRRALQSKSNNAQ